MRLLVIAVVLVLAGCPGPEVAPACEPQGNVVLVEFPAGGGPPVVSQP